MCYEGLYTSVQYLIKDSSLAGRLLIGVNVFFHLLGFYYMGNYLTEKKAFCDLSLYFNPDDIVEAARYIYP
jgi:hypothetical protein